MLFVTVGSMRGPLPRLTDALAKLPEELQRDIFYQGELPPELQGAIESKPILSRDEYDHYLSAADLVISHAGLGTILACINAGKKLIIFPRLTEFGEHFNDHQLELVEQILENPLPGVYCTQNIDQLHFEIVRIQNEILNESKQVGACESLKKAITSDIEIWLNL